LVDENLLEQSLITQEAQLMAGLSHLYIIKLLGMSDMLPVTRS